jgi:hypothetical protein
MSANRQQKLSRQGQNWGGTAGTKIRHAVLLKSNATNTTINHRPTHLCLNGQEHERAIGSMEKLPHRFFLLNRVKDGEEEE